MAVRDLPKVEAPVRFRYSAPKAIMRSASGGLRDGFDSRYPLQLPPGNPGKLADEIPVVVFCCAVPDLVAATLAQVPHAGALFFVVFKTHRGHETMAIGETIARNLEIDMQRKKTIRTMVAASPVFNRHHFLFTLLANKSFVYFDHFHNTQCHSEVRLADRRISPITQF